MNKATIMDHMKEAMKAHESQRLETLRFILSQLKYKEIELHRELTETEVTGVLNGEIKKRSEAITLFEKSGRTELAEEEKAKLAIIEKLLPPQMSDDALQAIVREVVASLDHPNMGTVIKEVMTRVGEQASGARVSAFVKTALGAA